MQYHSNPHKPIVCNPHWNFDNHLHSGNWTMFHLDCLIDCKNINIYWSNVCIVLCFSNKVRENSVFGLQSHLQLWLKIVDWNK